MSFSWYHIQAAICESLNSFLSSIFLLACIWYRCTINRSPSTPYKKAIFRPLHIFWGHWLVFFLPVSDKICHSPFEQIKRQSTLIISFYQQSPLKKNQAEIWPASYVTWGVGWGVCVKIVHTKMHFSASAWQTYTVNVYSEAHLKSNRAPIYPINGTKTASAKFQKVLFSWATKLEDCFCVITSYVPC